MTRHRVGARTLVVVAATMLLLAAHALVLYRLSSHLVASGAIAGAAIVLLVAKHLGVATWVAGVVRRRRGR